MEHEQVALCAFRLGGLEGHQALRSSQAALSESSGVRSDGAALAEAIARTSVEDFIAAYERRRA
jgi:hypothetical protein